MGFEPTARFHRSLKRKNESKEPLAVRTARDRNCNQTTLEPPIEVMNTGIDVDSPLANLESTTMNFGFQVRALFLPRAYCVPSSCVCRGRRWKAGGGFPWSWRPAVKLGRMGEATDAKRNRELPRQMTKAP
ncbi:hypothetical protein ACJRO7_026635 [Eucalyptus globulus]|uniref:Uncharacterized protein n=1 Tax=Eucalyptus globulus TaxID=34317 RepID=A0ABD3K1A5_EUCGL